jgi:hypothetical protein
MVFCRLKGVVVVSILATLCGACSDVRLKSLHGGQMLVTPAEYRAISQIPAGDKSIHGRISPKYLTCSEPSPDVAKALSTAFNVSASGGVTLPNGVTPEVAAAVSRAHAEALVQLGERLATIQLLRDGLHSACEAYANGAISDTTYAVMLSRFDKTMVTMLVSELTAGAFGRSLAAAGAGSEGSSSAAADLADKVTKSRQAEVAVQTAQQQRDAAQAAVGQADDSSKAAAQQTLDRSTKTLENSQRDFSNSLKAEAASAAKVATITAAGGISTSNNPEIAKTLAEIQRKYIENLNFDALEVACVSALDRGHSEDEVRAKAEAYGKTASQYGSLLAEAYHKPSQGGAEVEAMSKDLAKASSGEKKAMTAMANAAHGASITPLAAYCMSDLLPIIQAKKGELLKAVIIRAEKLKDSAVERADSRSEMKSALKEVEEYVAAVKALLEQIRVLKAVEVK